MQDTAFWGADLACFCSWLCYMGHRFTVVGVLAGGGGVPRVGTCPRLSLQRLQIFISQEE